MPSADFCHAVKPDLSGFSESIHTLQASRGKTLNFPPVDVKFIKRIPFADGGLRGHVPTRPEYVTPLIGFLSIAPRFRVGLPPDPASRQCPCPFANLRLCEYLVSELSFDELSAMPGTHVLNNWHFIARFRYAKISASE